MQVNELVTKLWSTPIYIWEFSSWDTYRSHPLSAQWSLKVPSSRDLLHIPYSSETKFVLTPLFLLQHAFSQTGTDFSADFLSNLSKLRKSFIWEIFFLLYFFSFWIMARAAGFPSAGFDSSATSKYAKNLFTKIQEMEIAVASVNNQRLLKRVCKNPQWLFSAGETVCDRNVQPIHGIQQRTDELNTSGSSSAGRALMQLLRY